MLVVPMGTVEVEEVVEDVEVTGMVSSGLTGMLAVEMGLILSEMAQLPTDTSETDANPARQGLL